MLQSFVELIALLFLKEIPKPVKLKKKTLVLDLDETLVHSTLHSQQHDFVVEVIQERSIMYCVSKRPFLDIFLKQVWSD
jgi:TFIIF-interacting CTD phosphatase-like protein